MKPRFEPYVGVTGFTDNTVCAGHVCITAEEHGISQYGMRNLMVGVLVSEKTLNRLPNNHPGKYPPIEWVSDAFVRGCINLVHYSSSNLETLSEQLWRVAGFIRSCGQPGIQLNVAWPAPSCVIQAVNRKPQIQRVVLQVRGVPPSAKNYPPFEPFPDGWAEPIAESIAGYRDFITDVLIDGSGGRGVLLDPDRCALVLEAIERECPWVGIGVAGGLCAETLDVLKPLLARWPQLSWDAESRLMTEDEKLDLGKVGAYLAKSKELLCGVQS